MADNMTISVQAHCKILLHAAKYPHCAVNGILLAEDNKGKENKIIKYVDCIPLFHVNLGLSPMLEISLLQIETYCKNNGLAIGGYYQANENLLDNKLNHIARTIGKKIQENFSDAYLLLVDNRKVSTQSVLQPYDIYRHKETGWSHVEKKETKEKTEDDEMKERCFFHLLHSGVHRELIDFDNHLNDVRNDWRNLELNEAIGRCT